MPGSVDIEGLYVHVPFCDGKCHYCAFYSVPYSPELGLAWLDALTAEYEAARRLLPPIAPDTVFIGGGTPSQLSPEQLESLLTRMRAPFVSGHSVREWTCEANPGSLDRCRLDLMKACGVNRISMGAQSMHDEVLHHLGRRHAVRDIRESAEAIRQAGFTNWSVDLIACVPGVTVEAWRETLLDAIDLGSPHVSVYALTREEGTRLAQDHQDGRAALLDDEVQLQMLDEAERLLGEAGLVRYEISNYARPGYECRHNLSCWRGGNYLGLGCAASSRIGSMRWTNKADLKGYLHALQSGMDDHSKMTAIRSDVEILSPQTDALERLIFGLRLTEGIDLEAILCGTGLEHSGIGQSWRSVMDRLSSEGYLVLKGGQWRLTGRGRAMADHVAVELIP